VTAGELIGCITLLAILLMAAMGVFLGFENGSMIAACEEKLILRSGRCELVAVPVIAPASSGEE